MKRLHVWAAAAAFLLLAACGGGGDEDSREAAAARGGNGGNGGGGSGGGSGSAVALVADAGVRSLVLAWADDGASQYNVVVSSARNCDIAKAT
jgi:hypothetical protein